MTPTEKRLAEIEERCKEWWVHYASYPNAEETVNFLLALIRRYREALEYGAKERNPNIYILMSKCMEALAWTPEEQE